MSYRPQEIVEMAHRDGRYSPEAFVFVNRSLQFAQQGLDLGDPEETQEGEEPLGDEEAVDDEIVEELPQGECSVDEELVAALAELGQEMGGPVQVERHVSGQQLCHAIRLLALQEFGFLAKCVFNNWGVTKTGDFGEIVYCMIDNGRMKKNDEDRREDFDDVFDFNQGLCQCFRIELAE